MKSNLSMNTESLANITSELEKKVMEVKEIFNNIDNKMKSFDGTSDIWRGKTQESVYNSYQTISNEFPIITEQLDNYNKFLKTTVENYISAENNIDNSIDSSSDDLDVN